MEIKGENTTYNFKEVSFRNFNFSTEKNCIAIVASFVKPNIYSMFFIKYMDDLKNLNKFFDHHLDHLLFIIHVNEEDKAEEIIDDIVSANPKHPIKNNKP